MSIPQSGGGLIENHAQLAQYLESGCKPKEDWRIGTEHEKFGFTNIDGAPLPYDGVDASVKAILEGLKTSFGWEPIVEAGNIIGLQKGMANISLEPGGQLELSGAPLKDIHATKAEIDSHLAEVKSVADPLGVSYVGLGSVPTWSRDQVPVMPKGRYALMTGHMDTVGSHGVDMMYRSCTVQVNLDFASEADMVQKLRTGIALQPVATALFACSPFFEGKDTGLQSYRSRCWLDTDASRTGMIPFIFEDGFGFEAWAEYALNTPMYFVYRDGKYLNALGKSFRDFLDGQLDTVSGETPLTSDWADHLTTLFPEARIKKFMEMRGADCGPASHLYALSAFWVGLMYDQGALDAATDVFKAWTAADRQSLRNDVVKDGLRSTVAGRSVQDVAKDVLEISASGLKARGLGEETYLQPLFEIATSGRTLADRLREGYAGGDLTGLMRDLAY